MAKKYKLTQDGPEVQALLNKIDELKANTAPVSGETPTALESLSLDGVLYSVLTKAVNDLLNYYTKDDTYTKDEVATALANALAGLHDVKYTAQSLTDPQKAQARTNIGATAPEVFWAEYGVTTAAEIDQAVADGKAVMCYYGTRLYVVSYWSATYIYLTTSTTTELSYLRVKRSNDSWSQGAVNAENIAYKKTTISGNESSDTYYPTTKAVADAIEAGKQVFWAEYGVTTLSEITTACNSGKAVLCLRQGSLYVISKLEASYCYFTCVNRTSSMFLLLNGQTSWSAGISSLQTTGNLSQSVETDKESTTKYPSTKAVWDGLKVRPVIDETSQETVPSLNLENTANKSQDVQTDRESIVKYPSVKAVFDSLGKWGVISQTQTWTGSGTNPRTYTMSDQVYGLISNELIEQAKRNGAVFNETSGYFELNDLTDISCEEMRNIIDANVLAHQFAISGGSIFRSIAHEKCPRTICIPDSPYTARNCQDGFRVASHETSDGSHIETISIGTQNGGGSGLLCSSLYQLCYGCHYLRKVGFSKPVAANSSASLELIFTNCYSLVDFMLKGLAKNVGLSLSPNFSLTSVVYMVTNSANTSAITITLHATAYARCQADTTEYTYNGSTYTGILAYAAARDITIASA